MIYLRPRSSVVEREIPASYWFLKAIRSIRVGVNLFFNFFVIIVAFSHASHALIPHPMGIPVL
jgi:hypothetical protein